MLSRINSIISIIRPTKITRLTTRFISSKYIDQIHYDTIIKQEENIQKLIDQTHDIVKSDKPDSDIKHDIDEPHHHVRYYKE